MPVIAISDRQRDAVLAGLRLLQEAHLAGRIEGDILGIFTNDGDHPGLDPTDLDRLCERISSGDQDVTMDLTLARRAFKKRDFAVKVAHASEDEVVVMNDGDEVIVNVDLTEKHPVKGHSQLMEDALDAVSRLGKPQLVRQDGKRPFAPVSP